MVYSLTSADDEQVTYWKTLAQMPLEVNAERCAEDRWRRTSSQSVSQERHANVAEMAPPIFCNRSTTQA
jgi:hypothetical protein